MAETSLMTAKPTGNEFVFARSRSGKGGNSEREVKAAVDASAELPAAAPVNILIVDDEPRNLAVVEAILNDPGYRLVRAETA